MSTCEQAQAKLSPYLDGEAGDDHAWIRAHVEVCEACQRVLDGYQRVSVRLHSAAGCEPPTLVAGIRDCLARHREDLDRKAPIVRLAVAAVLLALPLWTFVLIGREPPPILLGAISQLSNTEQRILYGELPTTDDWMAIVLRAGVPR